MDAARLLAMLTALLSMAALFLFKTYADTLFLSLTGSAWLPQLLAAQAVMMIVLAGVYAKLVRRLPQLQLDLLMLTGTLASGLTAPLLMERGTVGVFIATLLLLSLPAIANLALWNSAQGVVSGRAIRVFLPRLGAIAGGGAALGSLAATQLSVSLGVASLAPVATVITLLLIAVRVLMERNYPHGAVAGGKRQQQGMARRPLPAGSRQLIGLLIAATLIEALVAGLVDFSFKRALTLRLSDADLAVFLSLFYAATNGAMLLLQWFGASRLFSLYPLSRNTLLSPLVMTAMSLLWLLLPGLWMVAAARFADGVTRFSFARPCLEISLAPLDRVSRHRWKVLLRGAVAQSGTVIAGLLLVAITPLLLPMPWLLPALMLAAALGWLLVQRYVARAYVQLLAHIIGRRQLSSFQDSSDTRPDRSAVAATLRLLEDDKPATQRFTREFLASLELSPAELIPQLGVGAQTESVRTVLYNLIARHNGNPPGPRLRSALAEVVAAERPDDSPVYIAALHALAACNDDGEAERAQQLLRPLQQQRPAPANTDSAGPGSDRSSAVSDAPQPTSITPLQRAAAAYLARVGALSAEHIDLQRLIGQLLQHDGRLAGLTIRALIANQLIERDQVKTLLSAEATGRHRSGTMQAHAILAGKDSLHTLAEAMLAGRSEADSAIPLLSGKSLWKLVQQILVTNPPNETRRRLAWSLRFNHSSQSVRETARFLDDEWRPTRQTAVRTLLHKRQEQIGDPPRGRYNRALDQQLRRFEVLVRARLPAADRRTESLFDRELEQRTSEVLDELSGLLALSGDPASIFSAQRSLRSPDALLRGQSLDALQEVMRGRRQRDLIELLELYLIPSTPTQAERLRATSDPWLARCHDGSLDPIAGQLLALRETTLFRQLEGERLEELVHNGHCQLFDDGAEIIRRGDAAEHLFVLLEGQVEVITADGHRRRLGYPAVFGEMSITDGSPRSATVVARSATRLLRIDQAIFLQLIDDSPEVGIGLLGVLAGWLRSEREPGEVAPTNPPADDPAPSPDVG